MRFLPYSTLCLCGWKLGKSRLKQRGSRLADGSE